MPAAPTFPMPAFPTAEAAWFWAAATLAARRDPALPIPPPGPCRVEDVVKCLDVLYRACTLELLHVRILRHWGWRGVAPNPARPRDRSDWRLWREAMEALDAPLRARGIVAGPRCAIPADLLARARMEVEGALPAYAPTPSPSGRGLG